MSLPDRSFTDFLSRRHVMSLAVLSEGGPYAVPLFYLYDAASNSLIFKSDVDTVHSRAIERNGACSGSIYDPQTDVKKIKGLQFLGSVKMVREGTDKLAAAYEAAFPEASQIEGAHYRITVRWMKLTDNSVAFGFKKIWQNGSDS